MTDSFPSWRRRCRVLPLRACRGRARRLHSPRSAFTRSPVSVKKQQRRCHSDRAVWRGSAAV